MLRRTLAMAAMTMVAACGRPDGSTPWDANDDGLVAACEGLSPGACDATAGCERAPLYCTMDCRDDGHGGCLPCPASEVCQPVPVPPVPDCSQVPVALCGLVPACEVQSVTVCSGGGGTEPGAPTDPSVPPHTRCIGLDDCQTIATCVNRAPTRCEDLAADACHSVPGCGLEVGPVCEVACLAGSVCPPCATPEPRCVTLPPPDVCESRDASTCEADGACVLEGSGVCPAVCEDDGRGGCLPCDAPAPRCVSPGPVSGGGSPPPSPHP